MEGFEILFVDDEVEILNTVGEYLSQEGYKVTPSMFQLYPVCFSYIFEWQHKSRMEGGHP